MKRITSNETKSILHYRTIALEEFLDRKRDEIDKATNPVRCVEIFEEIERAHDRDAEWMKTHICFDGIPRTLLVKLEERLIKAQHKLYDTLDAKLLSWGVKVERGNKQQH